jgi:hypothetical protein
MSGRYSRCRILSVLRSVDEDAGAGAFWASVCGALGLEGFSVNRVLNLVCGSGRGVSAEQTPSLAGA